jgi:hypothetical protein
MYKAFDRYGEMRGRFESEPYLFIVRASEAQCVVALHIARDKDITEHVGKTVWHNVSSCLSIAECNLQLNDIFIFTRLQQCQNTNYFIVDTNNFRGKAWPESANLPAFLRINTAVVLDDGYRIASTSGSITA